MLAEDRTTEADRELIMEGEFGVAVAVFLLVTLSPLYTHLFFFILLLLRVIVFGMMRNCVDGKSPFKNCCC